jgi:amino acid adenylation domain-containing protein
MTGLQERLAALSPEKRALYDKLLAERGPAEGVFPISVLQQSIWFLEQLRPGTASYVIPAALHIRGPLRTGPLREALNEIVRRHEALRTTFQLRDGQPMQIVSPRRPVDLPEADLRECAPGELQAAIGAVVSEPFDLAAGPLLRLQLLRAGADEYVLALAVHHLVCDGWSVGILVSELAALYEAFVDGRPSPLPEMKIQYGDFATWQQERLGKESLAPGLAYWRQRLAGAPAALALPTDRPRPAVQGFSGSSVPFELPESLMRELGDLAKRQHATTYMALLAIFQILLHRYCHQDDVVVGVPTVNRDRGEFEPVIGYFVNMLAIRTDLSGNPGFAQTLRRVRDSCLGAYAHQEIPFDQIVEELKPARDLSRLPIFQVCFSYQSDPMPTLSVAGLELRRLPLKLEGARFDIELQSLHDGGGLTASFEYDRDLFDEPTIVRLASHFRRLAELVVAQPEAPVDRLALLDDAERREALAASRGPVAQWPGQGWIHQCFEQWARDAPDREAVRFEGEGVSYAELNLRANRLAHRLRRLGVGRFVLVAVAMERSVELVVSLLAVLKAGGAYLPLDPGYPRARLEYMLADAGAPVLLTQRRVLAGLPPADAEVLCVDELGDQLAAEPAGNPDVAVDGQDAAYMIYTSGSTGAPKGAVNVHAGIRNRLLWMQDAYGLDATDRVLQKTPFSFDVSVWEFFWPLLAGATLVVARPDGHRDGRYLVETIRREAITTLHFVPSMLQVFLREPAVETCTTLRRVICSGEALPRELQDRFFARSGAQLHNLYGPTEAAVDVTSWACQRDGDDRPVPIGFPIANTQMYVLDQYLELVPAGVAGELHIGGRNLARGYLNRPELTTEKFIPDPFDGGPRARLYKTGDLARFRDDGAIEYLGRLDRQVKLRGFRIELGEIESVLTRHPRVREAIVTARDRGDGDVRLVAYLTSDEPPSVSDLISCLKEELPDYMVPAAFEVLPAFPLLPNGKVNHAALPEPDLGRPDLRTPFAAPRDDLERSIAGIWRELLGITQVGTNDNFFDLGGHSLLMPGLQARLAATLGHEVPLVELFQYPTVGSLARYLGQPASSRADPMAGAHDRADSRRHAQDQRQQAATRRLRARTNR